MFLYFIFSLVAAAVWYFVSLRIWSDGDKNKGHLAIITMVFGVINILSLFLSMILDKLDRISILIK